MKKHIILFLLGAVLFAAHALAQVGDSDQPGRFSVRETCPVSLMTVKLDLQDTTTGIAVTFTASAAEVDELRRRVQLLAKKHRAAAEESVDVEFMPAGAMKYETVPDGARLLMTPMDANRLVLFRSEVHALVAKMREGNCEIMPQVR